MASNASVSSTSNGRMYYLSDQVHFCFLNENVVFLDLKNDEYYCINGTAAAAFRRLSAPSNSARWDKHLQSNDQASDFNLELEELSDVIATGLLTSDVEQGRAITPTISPTPTSVLLDPYEAPPSRAQLSTLPAFMTACTSAAIKLRWSSIESTVRSVRERKNKYKSSNFNINADKSRSLVNNYLKFRMLFPNDYLCLFDSLSLVEFLSYYDIFPNWVFGVQLDPWQAHCWVQCGDIVFNDSLERVLDFKPIMSV